VTVDPLERWLSCARSVVETRSEEIRSNPGFMATYAAGGAAESALARFKVSADIHVTWTRERSYCAVKSERGWHLVVDAGLVQSVIEMTAALESPNADAAVRGLLSQYMAARFRHAGLVHEATVFARIFRCLETEIASMTSRVNSIRSFAIPIEIYLFAHEVGHIMMTDDIGFSSTLKSSVVQIVELFVESQQNAGVDPNDPELNWQPENEILNVRRSIQAEWSKFLNYDNALQEELAADDIARIVTFSDSSASENPLKTAEIILATHLNIRVFEMLDSCVRWYQCLPRLEGESVASGRLLRSEYATVDLSYLVARMSDVAKEDIMSALRLVSRVHKELYDKTMRKFIAPMLVALMRGKGDGEAGWSLNSVEQEARELRLLDSLLPD